MLLRPFLQRSTTILPILAQTFPKSFSPSTSSHSDFQPSFKKSTNEIHDIIQDQVNTNPILLYMKGTPSAPMCGFSSHVVNILKNFNVDFSSVNVLQYPSIKEGIKEFSDWPTIPQLYVKGEFIGGCDVVKEMQENGELKILLETVEKEEDDGNPKM